MGNQGTQIIIAATILGLAFIGGSFLISRSVDEAAGQVKEFELAIRSIQATRAKDRPAPAKKRRSGPDPSIVYAVNTKGAPTLGPNAAKVRIVEFSDFQCPFCSRATPTLKKIHENYPDQVQIVFMHLPLSFHKNAQGAALAAAAAQRQGKFWEMHDKIFADQRALSPEKYLAFAAEIGLDVEQFEKDAASAQVKSFVEANKREAGRLGVTGTPGFFINGRFLSGAKPYDSFKVIIDEELAKS